jgi:hypothetical protein
MCSLRFSAGTTAIITKVFLWFFSFFLVNAREVPRMGSVCVLPNPFRIQHIWDTKSIVKRTTKKGCRQMRRLEHGKWIVLTSIQFWFVNSNGIYHLGNLSTGEIKKETVVLVSKRTIPTERPPLWSSCQSSWLQIQSSGFDSRRYQISEK